MSEPHVLFIDANTLSTPVTHTILIAGAGADGMEWAWSAHVEKEADSHTRGIAIKTSVVRRKILKSELSPTARTTRGLKTKTPSDRQVIADAIAAGARYLITTGVDDFAFDDLAAHETSAVNADCFMALRFSENAYREADPDQPNIIFRGVACIRCENRLDSDETLRVGLCAVHLPTD